MSRCLLLLAACAVALLAPTSAAGQWLEIRSPHFSVVTDAGERRGREVALRFEQMRSVFGTLLLRQKVNLPVPLQIVAFQSSVGLRRSAPLWKGKPMELDGFYQPGEDRGFLAVNLSSSQGYRTLFHAYAHLLLDGNYPRTQAWFNEGFAEYYSTIEIRDKEVELGRAPPSAALLLGGNFQSVTALFATTRDSSTYNESGGRHTLFYAQSWLVVHYLFDTGKLKETGAYFDLVQNQRAPIAQAIPRAFGMEPRQFDRELWDYAHSSRLASHTLEAPAGIDDAGYSVTRLDQADINAILADLHLHSSDHAEQAMQEFQAVLQLAPNHAAAHRGLGYAYLRKQQFEPAAEHLRRAAELDPSDARVHYYNALLMNLAGRVDDPWAMKKEAETAISLAPEFADAYQLLAAANAAEGDMEGAIAAVTKAVRLSPRNDVYLSNLAQYSMMAQKWDDALALFELLKTSSDSGLAALAAQNLERIPRMRANPPPMVVRRERATDWSQYDDPQWRRRAPAPATPPPAEEPPPPPDNRAIKFLKGKLLQVECSQGSAVLTVLAGKTTWKLRARDTQALVLVGADAFSCDWRNRSVAVNYRESAPGQGDLVSLELD